MTDYIDRKAFIEDIKVEITNLKLNGLKGTPRPCDELYGFIDRIKEQPAADVARVVHGKWKFAFEFNDYIFYYCSVCGRLDFLLKNHESHDMNVQCPYCHCGAKMDGKGEDYAD